jgi:hypothetical protein
MKQNSLKYAISVEITNSVIIGILLFMGCCVVLWLAHILVSVDVLSSVLQALQTEDFLLQSGRTIFMLLMGVLGFTFWGLIVWVVALVQCVLIAIPFASLLTKGLLEDAKRSYAFYVIMGFLIGGGPWWTFASFVFDAKLDLGSAAIILAPGTIVGAFAGAAFKHRLVRLAIRSNIENKPTNYNF